LIKASQTTPVDGQEPTSTIRPEIAEDHAAIRVVEQVLGQPAEADLSRSCENTPPAHSVAESDEGEVVGHILFSPVSIETEGDAGGDGSGADGGAADYQTRNRQSWSGLAKVMDTRLWPSWAPLSAIRSPAGTGIRSDATFPMKRSWCLPELTPVLCVEEKAR
jgi:hypothetical protein